MPAILIPSPNVTADHQHKNAQVLANGGGAVLLPEQDCTAQGLYDQVKELLTDDDRRAEMKKALGTMAVADSAERICDILEELIRG